MPDTNISNAVTGDNATTFEDFAVDPAVTDAATGSEETEYMIKDAAQYLGYYKKIPELKAAIDAKATWTVGKGFIADPLTTTYLDRIRGFGVDTFNTILENCIRSYHIYGDSFCEVIRDTKGFPINLKPLDPGSMRIVANAEGIIRRYEQVSKVNFLKKASNKILGTKFGVKKFTPKQIFHLAKNRVADEIHGTSIIPAMEWIILARNEAMTDYRIMMHRNIYPVRIWEADTDKQSKLAELKAQAAKAKYEGEDLFVPKGCLLQQNAGLPGNATIDPKAWIEQLNKYFFEACGTPKIVIGNAADFTESSVKIVYLTWEQTVEEEQLYIEEQVGHQLGFQIDLRFPATLQNELLSDQAKDSTPRQQLNQPSQTAVTKGM